MTNGSSATTRRTWVYFITLALVVAVVIGAVLVVVALRSGPVAWVDRPATTAMINAQVPQPLPSPPPKTNAPPCSSADLAVTREWPDGVDGALTIGVTLRNVGSSACLERATPSVVAYSSRGPHIKATAVQLLPGTQVANTAARAEVSVQILMPEYCASDPTGANLGLPTYQRYAMTLPGGATMTLAGPDVALPCGLEVTPFYSAAPQPKYAPIYLHNLNAHVVAPTSVDAGTTLDYVVDLSNPTSRAVRLSPCPIYLEYGDYVPHPINLSFLLDCQAVRAIPADATVAYRMEMPIPKTIPAGPMRIYWGMIVYGRAFAQTVVHVKSAGG